MGIFEHEKALSLLCIHVKASESLMEIGVSIGEAIPELLQRLEIPASLVLGGTDSKSTDDLLLVTKRAMDAGEAMLLHLVTKATPAQVLRSIPSSVGLRALLPVVNMGVIAEHCRVVFGDALPPPIMSHITITIQSPIVAQQPRTMGPFMVSIVNAYVTTTLGVSTLFPGMESLRELIMMPGKRPSIRLGFDTALSAEQLNDLDFYLRAKVAAWMCLDYIADSIKLSETGDQKACIDGEHVSLAKGLLCPLIFKGPAAVTDKDFAMGISIDFQLRSTRKIFYLAHLLTEIMTLGTFSLYPSLAMLRRTKASKYRLEVIFQSADATVGLQAQAVTLYGLELFINAFQPESMASKTTFELPESRKGKAQALGLRFCSNKEGFHSGRDFRYQSVVEIARTPPTRSQRRPKTNVPVPKQGPALTTTPPEPEVVDADVIIERRPTALLHPSSRVPGHILRLHLK